MNSNSFTLSKPRIVFWTFGWILICTVLATNLGLNGWPWRLGWLEPYMPSKNGWQHGAFTIERLRREQTLADRFIFIGGSACMQAIESDAVIQSNIRKITNTAAEFHSICSNYTTLTESAKVIERLGINVGTIVLLVDPSIFTKGIKKQYKHQLKGETLPKYFMLKMPDGIKTTLNAHGADILIGHDYINYLRYGPTRILASLVRGRGRANSEAYQKHPVKKNVPENVVIDRILAQTPIPAQTIKLNLELLGKLHEIAQSRGNDFIVLNFPNADPFEDELENMFPQYDHEIEKFVTTENVRHIDVRNTVPWPKSFFYDKHHMNASGRSVFSTILAQELAIQVEDMTSR